jgi:hypothetical protein
MTTGKNRCIISFANHKGRYIQSLCRLSESLNGRFDGDFLSWIGEASLGAEPHLENPYNFKIHAFAKAIEAGYTQILWIDSSCFAIKDVAPIFDIIEKEGYIMQEAGHMVGTWTNDNALNYFGITRDEAMLMPMYGNAGFLGLNMENQISADFFCLWSASMLAGCFKGSWTNENHSESMDERCLGSRHDMAAGSIIANQLGMLYKSGNEWLEYAAPGTTPKNETIIIQAAGM